MVKTRSARLAPSIVTVGLAVAVAGMPSQATAASGDDDIAFLQQVADGSSSDGSAQLGAAQLEADLRAEAVERGLTYQQVVDRVADEAVEVRAPAGMPLARSSGSGSGGGSGTVQFPRASRAGDVFVHSSRTASVNHGHAGLYSSTTYVIEAPGGGKKSRQISITQRRGPKNEFWLYRVGESSKRRSAAITQSRKYYLSKPYDSSFYNNRSNGSSKLNCSELVWRAFKYNSYSKIDIDSNKGWGVYPKNIQDSGWTHFYKGV